MSPRVALSKASKTDAKGIFIGGGIKEPGNEAATPTEFDFRAVKLCVLRKKSSVRMHSSEKDTPLGVRPQSSQRAPEKINGAPVRT